MQQITYLSVSLLAYLWMVDCYGLQHEKAVIEPQKYFRPKSTYDCDTHQNMAKKRLREVMDAHLSCSTDSDCKIISLITSCSDQCTTSINHEGAKMFLSATISAINNEICAGYNEANCKLIHPPCAPPRPPACVSGMCQ